MIRIIDQSRRQLQALLETAAAEDVTPDMEERAAGKVGIEMTGYTENGAHLDVLCEPSQVRDVAMALDSLGFFLETITGVDWPKENQMEVVYDYSRQDGQPGRVMVRARIDRQQPVMPSIATIIPGADWHERETHDFFGIVFQGHPNLETLLLPEDADFHPLRKDFIP